MKHVAPQQLSRVVISLHPWSNYLARLSSTTTCSQSYECKQSEEGFQGFPVGGLSR